MFEKLQLEIKTPYFLNGQMLDKMIACAYLAMTFLAWKGLRCRRNAACYQAMKEQHRRQKTVGSAALTSFRCQSKSMEDSVMFKIAVRSFSSPAMKQKPERRCQYSTDPHSLEEASRF